MITMITVTVPLRRICRLVVVGTLLLGAVGCSAPGPLDGAVVRVGTWRLSREQLITELDAAATSPAFVASRQARAPGWRPYGDGPGGFDRRLVAELLALHIERQLIADELARRGLAPTDDDVRLATAELATSLGLALGAILTGGTLPPDSDAAVRSLGPYGEVVVSHGAQERALRRAFEAEIDTDQEMRKRYEADDRALATRICARQIVAKAPSSDPGALQEAFARLTPALADLDRGVDFAEVARTWSQDPGGATSGGDLGCGPASRFDPALRDAVVSQPVGQVGPPLLVGSTYRVVLVTSRDPVSFEELEPQLRALVSDEGARRYDAWLRDARRNTTIVVDPAWGTWAPGSGEVIDPVAADAIRKALTRSWGTTTVGTADAATSVPSSSLP